MDIIDFSVSNIGYDFERLQWQFYYTSTTLLVHRDIIPLSSTLKQCWYPSLKIKMLKLENEVHLKCIFSLDFDENVSCICSIISSLLFSIYCYYFQVVMTKVPNTNLQKNKSPIWRRFVRLPWFHCLERLSIILAGNCHYKSGISIMSNSKVIVIMARSFLDLQATPFIHDIYALFLLRRDCYNDGLILLSVFIAHTFSLKKNVSPQFFKIFLNNLIRRWTRF